MFTRLVTVPPRIVPTESVTKLAAAEKEYNTCKIDCLAHGV